MLQSFNDDHEPFIPSLGDQMDLIKEILDKATAEGLQVEVVTWALQAMQDDPELQPYEAIVVGYQEWVK